MTARVAIGPKRALGGTVAERILFDEGPAKSSRSGGSGPEVWDARTAAKVALWTGLVLALAALVDFGLALYPWLLGSPEWEFATISQIIAGLPLVTIGLVGIWVGGGYLGRRWLLIVTGVLFLLAAACVGASLLLFATNIPTALRATQQLGRDGIVKLTVKTLVLGMLFGIAYIVAGVLAVRHARKVLT